jgi:putative DNA primase/helicase
MKPDDYNARAMKGEPIPDLEEAAGTAAELLPLTETGNAERFAEECHTDVRYVPAWRSWLVWTGTEWSPDVGDILVQGRIKQSHRRLYQLAAACTDDDLRKQIGKWARASDRRTSREATQKLARSEPHMVVNHVELDRHPLLLNVVNGTIDLATGRLKGHRRDDLISRTVPVRYDEKVACPRWKTFLGEILPDSETVAYVQRAVGYSLTGLVREHCLFVLWGAGLNGKSTMLTVLLELLGPYATQAPAQLLLARRGESHPTEVTVLHGRRMVVSQETDDNRRWAEATVKQLTGGDRLIARRMREDFWEFEPTHKLWMATNHRPEVRGQDEGIWRRIKLIPFERVIPPERRNRALVEELRAELPGILRWAVEGCLAWQREGLSDTEAVAHAVAEYRAAEDRLAPFLDECCVVEPDGKISRPDLRRRYETWAQANVEGKALGPREFTAQLRLKGAVQKQIRSGGQAVRGWVGIRLRHQDELERGHVDTCGQQLPIPTHTRARGTGEPEMVSTSDHVSTAEQETTDG